MIASKICQEKIVTKYRGKIMQNITYTKKQTRWHQYQLFNILIATGTKLLL